MDAFATSISIALQYGVPIQVIAKKFSHARFEPSGFTNNPQIRIAKSIIDYIARYLGLKFLSPEEQLQIGISNDSPAAAASSQATLDFEESPAPTQPADQDSETIAATMVVEEEVDPIVKRSTTDAPICSTCGSLMSFKTGSCYTCTVCGNTSGGCG
jgi:ribonucleoside-diphosphate reductase alpha chain